MNELVNTLMEKPNLPALFTFNDFEKRGYKKDRFDEEISEGIAEEYINRVYNDIYTLNSKYREKVIPKGVLSQMIVPDSYVSLYYVLWKWDWIPESIFSVTSVSETEDTTIDTDRFGTYIYIHLYPKLPSAGIHIKNDFEGSYKVATPLRALCDLLYYTDKEWPWSLLNIYEHFRIFSEDIAEDLTGKDFDELHGAFGIKNIEDFLVETRKELKI